MNTFKIGDKVRVREDRYGILARAGFKLNTTYTVAGIDQIGIDGIGGGSVYLKETRGCLHYTHLALYKEANEDVMTQQTQQKTKRIHFTHKLWEKWKDVAKIIYIPSGGEVLRFAYFPEADSRFCYAYLTRSGTAPAFGSGESFWLEIPVTAKRIPFNPELKDAKVFYGDTELIEWLQMNSGVVCGSYDTGGIDGVITNLYHPNDLQMEIEE